MLIYRCLFVFCFLVLFGTTISVASDPAPNATDVEIDALVRQLGSSSFEVRELAATKLRKIGLAAKQALMDARKAPDVEVRMRVKRLLVAIEQSDFERRLKAFLDDDQGLVEHHLPGWKRFASVVGRDVDARQSFAAAIRAEPELFRLIDEDAKQSARHFEDRVQAIELSENLGLGSPVSSGTLTALLFISTQVADKVALEFTHRMLALLSRRSATVIINSGSKKQLVPFLMRWLATNSTDAQIAQGGLYLILRLGLEDGVSLARDLVARAGGPSSTVAHASLTIGRFGDQTDIPRLEPLLENDQVCHTWQSGQRENAVDIQVRDVVLATLIHLSGQEHKDYGMEAMQRNETTLFSIFSCRFTSQERRNESLARWRKWAVGGDEKEME